MGGFANLFPVLRNIFDIPEGQEVWPPASLNIAVATLLFPMGQLCDKIGDFYVFCLGWIVFTLATGASIGATHFKYLIATRAMQGVGAACILPAGVGLLSRTYPPGRKKNRIFGCYGAIGPLGFWLGIIVSGTTETELH